jgi:hypothetical protein
MQNPGSNAAPFNMAFKTEAKLWDWYEEPENNWRARRFSAVMKDSSKQVRSSAEADLINSELMGGA